MCRCSCPARSAEQKWRRTHPLMNYMCSARSAEQTCRGLSHFGVIFVNSNEKDAGRIVSSNKTKTDTSNNTFSCFQQQRPNRNSTHDSQRQRPPPYRKTNSLEQPHKKRLALGKVGSGRFLRRSASCEGWLLTLMKESIPWKGIV